MFEYSSCRRITHNLGCGDVFLFSQRQYLTANQSRRAAPAEQCYHYHEYINALVGGYLPRIDDRGGNKQYRKRGNTVENINYTHYNLVYPASVVAGNTAQYHADKRLQNYDYKSYRKRNSSAVHKTHEHVHTFIVGTENVIAVQRRVRVGGAFLLQLLDNGDSGAVRHLLFDCVIIGVDGGRAVGDIRLPLVVDNRS